MILDKIQNWRTYFDNELWKAAFAHLETLTADAPEGRTDLLGENGGDLFVGVSQYSTRLRRDGIAETHRRRIDIQVCLSGVETIEWNPAESMTVQTPYDADKDATFYRIPEQSQCRFVLKPGMFAVFFPDDAHMPSLMAEGHSNLVKKVVYKLNIDRFLQSS